MHDFMSMFCTEDLLKHSEPLTRKICLLYINAKELKMAKGSAIKSTGLTIFAK